MRITEIEKLLDIPDMTDSDVESIKKQQALIHNHRVNNQKSIAKRKAARARRLDEISKRQAFFDLGQYMVKYKNSFEENGDESLLEYGQSYQEDDIYIPKTVLDDPLQTAQIHDLGKYVSCDLGVKVHHNKCRICHFQSLPSSTLGECQQVLQDTFGMKMFRDGQYEMFKAFADGQSIIARKKTSYGKSFIHTFSALATPHTMFNVICPIISLVDDQFYKLNCIYQIPAAKYYGELPIQYRENMFYEVSKKYIKVLLITTESFTSRSTQLWMNNMVVQLGLKLQFVIDEGHCCSPSYYGRWRMSYEAIPKIYQSQEFRFNRFPIAIVSATITDEDSTYFTSIFGLSNVYYDLDTGAQLQRQNLKFSVQKRQKKSKNLVDYLKKNNRKE